MARNAAQEGLYRAQFGFVADFLEEAEKTARPVTRPLVETLGQGLTTTDRALRWYERNVTARLRRPFQGLERKVSALPTPLEIPARIGLGVGGAAAGGLLGLAAAGPVGGIAGAAAGSTLAWGPASTKVWPYMIDPTTYVGMGAAGMPLKTAARGAQLAERASNVARGRAAFRVLATGLTDVRGEPIASEGVRALWKTASVMDWPERMALLPLGKTAEAIARGPEGPLREAGALIKGARTGELGQIRGRPLGGIAPRAQASFGDRLLHEADTLVQQAAAREGHPTSARFLDGLLTADAADLPPHLRTLQPVARLAARLKNGETAVQELASLPPSEAGKRLGQMLEAAAKKPGTWVQEPGTSWWKMTDPLWPELKESLSLPYFQRAWEVAGVKIPILGAVARGATTWPVVSWPFHALNFASKWSLEFALFGPGNATEASLIMMGGDGRALGAGARAAIAQKFESHPLLRDLYSGARLRGMEALKDEHPAQLTAGAVKRFAEGAGKVPLSARAQSAMASDMLGKSFHQTEFAHRYLGFLDGEAKRGNTALGALLDEIPAVDDATAMHVLLEGPERAGQAAREAHNLNDGARWVRGQMYEDLLARFPQVSRYPHVAGYLGSWKERGFTGTDALRTLLGDAFEAGPSQEMLLAQEKARYAFDAITDGVKTAQTAEDLRRWRATYEYASTNMVTAQAMYRREPTAWAAKLPLDEQDAAYQAFEAAMKAGQGEMDEALGRATDAIVERAREMDQPWAEAYATVSRENAAAWRDGFRQLEELKAQVLSVPKKKRGPLWPEYYRQKAEIMNPIHRRAIDTHLARNDAQLELEYAAALTAPGDRTPVQALQDLRRSGPGQTAFERRISEEGQALLSAIDDFDRVPPEVAAMVEENTRTFLGRAETLLDRMTPEQRRAMLGARDLALRDSAEASKNVALWGRDVNVFEAFLRAAGLPYIGYELRRPLRFGVLGAKRPGLALDFYRYYTSTDKGYFDMPGSPLDFSFARLIGLGPLRGLLSPAFDPEHEGALGAMEKAGDWATKFGFFPMGLELATAATLGANGDMEGVARFLSVPPAQAVLDTAGLLGVPGAAEFHEAFPEPFREQMVRAQLIDNGIDPDQATPEERDRAFKQTALPSLIAAQTGAARFRPEGLREIWRARADAAKAAGVPKDVVQRYLDSNRNPIYASGEDGKPFLNVAQQRQAQRAAAEKLGISEDLVAASSRAWLHIRPEKEQRRVDYNNVLRGEMDKLENDVLAPRIHALDRGQITLEEFRRVFKELATQRQAVRAQVMRQFDLTEEDMARSRENLRPEDLAADDYYSIDLADFNGNGSEDDADWEEFKRRRKAVLDANPQHANYILDEYPKKVWKTPRAQELSDEYRQAVRNLDDFLQLPRWRGLDGEQSRRVDEMQHFVGILTKALQDRYGEPMGSRAAQVQIWRQAGRLLKDWAASPPAPNDTPLLSKGLREQDKELFKFAFRLAMAGDDGRERMRDPAPTLYALANPRIIEWYPGMTSRIVGSRRLRIVASELGIAERPAVAALLDAAGL